MHWLQHSFSVNPAVLAPGHPYTVYPGSKSCTIHFYEFRGIGPPSADFGHAGDVYVDLNPRLHALYWRERDVVRGGDGPWMRWTAFRLDQVPLYKFLVSHPWALTRHSEASDLYLWVDPGGVTWTSKDELCASRKKMNQRNIATVAPGTVPDVQALISEVLQRMVYAERNDVGRPHDVSVHGERTTPSPIFRPRTSIEPIHRAGSSSLPFRPPPIRQQESSQSPVPPAQSPGLQAQFHSAPSSYFPSEYHSHPPGGSHPPSYAYHGQMQRPQEDERHRHASDDHAAQKGAAVSYHYQKRERELFAALVATEQRSSTELEEMRAAAQALQLQAQAAQEQTQRAAAQVQRSQEELDAIQAEINNMQSRNKP
ncbi:hypothetical protein GGX14DRAFT_578521 [Mycena pura]|uniref:Uncharacterized protein n=1 Tax=Mycena pura TaxID=153505 RepID=A0AAD6UPR9_9AGAR|nr:hypothetical protein GGX14DRAFT_578521 [Mycena pura]